jgi:hypothetical protein
MWERRDTLNRNAWPHCGHLCGLRPVWLRTCNFKLHLWLNPAPHTSHRNGFAPLCTRWCLAKWPRERKDLEQTSHTFTLCPDELFSSFAESFALLLDLEWQPLHHTVFPASPVLLLWRNCASSPCWPHTWQRQIIVPMPWVTICSVVWSTTSRKVWHNKHSSLPWGPIFTVTGESSWPQSSNALLRSNVVSATGNWTLLLTDTSWK